MRWRCSRWKSWFRKIIYSVRSPERSIFPSVANEAGICTVPTTVARHSTLSQNRRHRFADNPIYLEIFDAIVLQAMGRGMVESKVLYTDSTHLKANANKNKFDYVQVEQRPSKYLSQLEAAIAQDRAEHGKRCLPEKYDGDPPTWQVKVSGTDL